MMKQPKGLYDYAAALLASWPVQLAMTAAATPQWVAYISTSYAPAVRQLAAAVAAAAAAQCPTYRPH